MLQIHIYYNTEYTRAQAKNRIAKKGTPIRFLDTLIAAHAKSLELTLVTNNTREFARVGWVGAGRLGKLDTS